MKPEQVILCYVNLERQGRQKQHAAVLVNHLCIALAIEICMVAAYSHKVTGPLRFNVSAVLQMCSLECQFLKCINFAYVPSVHFSITFM